MGLFEAGEERSAPLFGDLSNGIRGFQGSSSRPWGGAYWVGGESEAALGNRRQGIEEELFWGWHQTCLGTQ